MDKQKRIAKFDAYHNTHLWCAFFIKPKNKTGSSIKKCDIISDTQIINV